MFKLHCPSCGAEVKFLSKASTFAVCPYCSSTLVRNDEEVKKIGQMSSLQDDMSPLQLGTTGVCRGASFVLIGRIRLGWERGGWDEWYMLEEGSKPGWLAHAQGFYMVSYETDTPEGVELDRLSPGVRVQISGAEFVVQDRKSVNCVFSEGELPFAVQQGKPIVSVDLVGPNNAFASISGTPGQEQSFVGRYYQFRELSFQNVRTIDGWAA